eukprot:8110586-Ditylum_brightwellii.AAC.1
MEGLSSSVNPFAEHVVWGDGSGGSGDCGDCGFVKKQEGGESSNVDFPLGLGGMMCKNVSISWTPVTGGVSNEYVQFLLPIPHNNSLTFDE